MPSYNRHSGSVGKLRVCGAAVASNDLVTEVELYGTPPTVPAAAVAVIVQRPTSSKLTVPLGVTEQIAGVDVVYVTANPVLVVAAKLKSATLYALSVGLNVSTCPAVTVNDRLNVDAA